MGGDNLLESVFVNIAGEKFKAGWHGLEGIHVPAFADERCQQAGVKPGLRPQIEAAHTLLDQSLDKSDGSRFIQSKAHPHSHLAIAAVEPETKTVRLSHEKPVRRKMSTRALILRRIDHTTQELA